MAVSDNYQTVSVYLPPELAQKVKDYAIEHKLTRKSKVGDKPALGTAVVDILNSILDSPLPSKIPSQVLFKASQAPDNVLSSVLERLDCLESITSQLQNTRLGYTPIWQIMTLFLFSRHFFKSRSGRSFQP